jgi:hypothetical protein
VLLREAGEIDDQRGGQGVPGQDVPASALHDGRGRGQVVQDPLQLGLDLLPAAAPGTGGGLARELEEIAALVVIQVEHPGQDIQDGRGRLHPALFETHVVARRM